MLSLTTFTSYISLSGPLASIPVVLCLMKAVVFREGEVVVRPPGVGKSCFRVNST